MEDAVVESKCGLCEQHVARVAGKCEWRHAWCEPCGNLYVCFRPERPPATMAERMSKDELDGAIVCIVCMHHMVNNRRIDNATAPCEFCDEEFPFDTVELHKLECSKRATRCKYFLIGCMWFGGLHEQAEHESVCSQPQKLGIDLMADVEFLETIFTDHNKMRRMVIELLQSSAISSHDFVVAPYNQLMYDNELWYRSNTFKAFDCLWYIRLKLGNVFNSWECRYERALIYKLIRDDGSDRQDALTVNYFAMQRPVNELRTVREVHRFLFGGTNNVSRTSVLPLSEIEKVTPRLLKRGFCFRLMMLVHDPTRINANGGNPIGNNNHNNNMNINNNNNNNTHHHHNNSSNINHMALSMTLHCEPPQNYQQQQQQQQQSDLQFLHQQQHQHQHHDGQFGGENNSELHHQQQAMADNNSNVNAMDGQGNVEPRRSLALMRHEPLAMLQGDREPGIQILTQPLSIPMPLALPLQLSLPLPLPMARTPMNMQALHMQMRMPTMQSAARMSQPMYMAVPRIVRMSALPQMLQMSQPNGPNVHRGDQQIRLALSNPNSDSSSNSNSSSISNMNPNPNSLSVAMDVDTEPDLLPNRHIK